MSEARDYPGRPLVGVGCVLWRGDEVLLVRRSKPPLAGAWSLPGGAQRLGETVREAALRELKEETGLDAEILGLVDVVDGIFPDAGGTVRNHYTLIDFAARPTGGHLAAADDAAEARWHPAAALPGLGLWRETLRVIEAARRFFE
jgi:8-oxo-dGTP diphosphatase